MAGGRGAGGRGFGASRPQGQQTSAALAVVEKRLQTLEGSVSSQFSKDEIAAMVEGMVEEKVREEVVKLSKGIQQQLINIRAGTEPAETSRSTGGYGSVDDLRKDEERINPMVNG